MNRTAGADMPTIRPTNGQPSNPQPEEERRGPAGAIDKFLKSPFAGIAPWALLAILSAPGRFEVAVGAALGLSLLVMAVSRVRGYKIHLLEVFGAAVFAALAVVGLFASAGVIGFMEGWAGEITNVSLAGFAWATLMIGKPFTMSYAKETTPREYWGSPLFNRVNNTITAVWASAFTFAAVVGFVGGLFLHDAGNFWTGWILQLVGIFFAISFSEFYPEYASAKFDLANGEPAQVPSIAKIAAFLPTFVVVTGIAGLVTGSIDGTVGLVLIVAGSVGSGILAKALPANTNGLSNSDG